MAKDSLYLIERPQVISYHVHENWIAGKQGNPAYDGNIQKGAIEIMNGPIISFDVSKGSSHMQGFLDHGKPAGKATVIRHDLKDFAKIDALRGKIREETGSNPVAVYEYTGVYSHTLERYLDSIGMRRYAISPLESAKVRKAMIRPTKNDSLDCRTIAEVYYLRTLREVRNDDEIHDSLRDMGRFYHYLLEVKIVEKGRYYRCLDDVWPCFDKVIEPNSPKSLAIISHYGHPSKIRSKEQVKNFLMKLPRHGRVSTDELAEKIAAYAKTHVSGASPDSYKVKEVKMMSARVKGIINESERVMDSMISKAENLPEFALLKTIPGIADVTATRLIAEIGDINAYPKADSLIAYAGLDPAVMQSGQMTGEHMHITKKGNSHLRATLFVAVINMIISKAENMITRYVLKKKNSGLSYKAAVIAGCSKLLRLIHAMLRNGTCYSDK